MNTVPFKVDLFAGFGSCNGLLRDEGEHLALEFQNQDNIAGIIKSGVKQVRVPLNDLVSVTITKGWLGGRWMGVTIVLQAARMETLQDIPGMSQGRVALSVASKDRDAAERFVAGLHQEAPVSSES
jgi:hypothetical protein